MRKKLALFLCLLNFINVTYSQVFWTENFNNGCTSACSGVGYTGANGPWAQTILGVEGADPNAWFVSCAEQNNGIGACSSGCTGGGNASMHVSAAISNPFCPNDCGAAYDAGGLCGIIACPQTNRRIESPVINCTGKTSISLNYAYIHQGTVGTDFANVWYFNGATWTNLGVVPQSVLCGGQGTWASATVALPASANNNASVKIGFSWQNDDDGAGTDPSIAVDDVTLSVPTTTTPPLTFSLSLPSPVCQANTINATFTSTSTPTSFTWSASSANVVFTPPNSGTTTISFTAPGTYTVSLTACQGTVCGTATSSVQVLPTPTINVTASPTVVCVPGSSTLTATGGPSAGSYTWTASSGPAITNTNVAIVSPTSTTTYTVLTSIPGCTTGISIVVPVAPAPTLTLTPNSSICNGQSINLTASGASTYTWSPSATLSSPNGAAVTATPVVTTTYVVTGSNGACTNTASVIITVGASASVSITPTNTTICSGQSASLTATGGSTYTWTASSGTNPPGTAGVSVNPTITTTYTVLTGSGSCTAQAVSSVSVAPAFTMTATPATATICNGGAVVVLTAGGASTYTWSPSTGLSSTTGSTVNANPTGNTTYTVTGNNGACSNTAAISVTVDPAGTVTVTPTSTTICSGQSASITAIGGISYTWTASVGSNPPNTASISVTPTITTTYTVLTGTGACTAQAVTTVSVAPALTTTVTPITSTICTGGTGVVLTANGATTYSWSPATGLSSSSGSTVNATPTVNTTYTVTGGNGVCTSTATTDVNVTTVSTSVTASSTNYCAGASPVTLTANGATTYSWSPATGLSATSGSAVSATPSVTTTYTVTGATGTCSLNATVTITVTPSGTITASPSSTTICTGNSTTLTANGASTYTWLPGSMTTSVVAVTPTITTSYTVTGQSVSGCLAIPAVVTVSVLPSINPTITASSSSVCLTQTVAISTQSTTGLTYTWQPTTAISGSINSYSIVAMPASSATVIYTVTISNGICVGSNTVQLQVFRAPVNNFITLNNDTICTGGCVTFSATTSGSQPITYKWYYESGVGTSSVGVAPEACYPSAGSFSVMSVASNMCGTDTVVKSNFVQVYDLPVIVVRGDTMIKIGGNAEVFSSGGLSYSWSSQPVDVNIACPTCSNTIVQPTLTTIYIVVASNSQYCKVQDTVTVTVDTDCGEFFIPNVFSPNDDGLNDMINIHGRCLYAFTLQIFDRWGEKIFETSSLENSWDGTYKGKKLDTGVFVYKADGVAIDGQSFNLKGNITLLR